MVIYSQSRPKVALWCHCEGFMKGMRNKTFGNLPNTMPDVCREPTRLELNVMLNAGDSHPDSSRDRRVPSE